MFHVIDVDSVINGALNDSAAATARPMQEAQAMMDQQQRRPSAFVSHRSVRDVTANFIAATAEPAAADSLVLRTRHGELATGGDGLPLLSRGSNDASQSNERINTELSRALKEAAKGWRAGVSLDVVELPAVVGSVRICDSGYGWLGEIHV